MKMMSRKYPLFLAFVSAALFAADQPWKDKPAAEWSESDARQIVSDSPWAKSVVPTMKKQGEGSPGGMGRSGPRIGGIGIGGIGGIGGPQTRGRGGAGRGVPQAGPDTSGTPPTLTVRWESALPIQAAQLKIRDANSPSVDEAYYTIAVLGLPSRIAGRDPQNLANHLKHQAELKRDGKKTIRSSGARVLPRDEGLIVLFLFPRSNEITRDDRRVEFVAQIAAFELTQSFDLSEMTYAGKLEL
jgi:hypothetical protein